MPKLWENQKSFPFKISFIPLSAFDNQDKKLYLEIDINKEGTLEELKQNFSKALAFAVGVGYTSEDTIKFLLGKAVAQERKLTRIITGEPEAVETASIQVETQETKKEEKPANAAEGLASLFG